MSIDDRLARADALEAEAAALRKEARENPPEVRRVPYLIEDRPGEYRVGCKDEPEVGGYPYVGPCASVYADKSFVYISTDPYDGTAMINLEALPLLIESLRKLEAHIKSSDAPLAVISGIEKGRKRK